MRDLQLKPIVLLVLLPDTTKFAAAYLLCNLAGKEPTKANISEILDSVGIACGAGCDTLLKAMEDKELAEVLEAGEAFLARAIP